jgi:hypothetical protein
MIMRELTMNSLLSWQVNCVILTETNGLTNTSKSEPRLHSLRKIPYTNRSIF